ncbi:MAG: 50S ribosomal protein L10 [Burkholderiales bacterium]|nr:50S ribosomal protein L10 [Burkholderiales bacterium]MBP9769253.1 50S ribosomal protein L10 [Burkholderiales bacterium]MBX9866310.1 50S ribosomal protein L10 [Burkholderiales bacterium]MDQ5947916.1 large subunit ribosomal protein [Pseudomonadota bacterium]
MSLNLQNKKAVVAQVSETLSTAQTIVIAEYAGVTVESMTVIRAQARKANVFLHVVKNTLARIATEGTKFAPLADQMVGQLIYAVSDDPIAAAKIISDFVKANSKVKIVAGMYNDQMLDAAGVKQLAAMPSRDELLAMAMGVMQQVPAGFVRVVAALRDKKEQEAA